MEIERQKYFQVILEKYFRLEEQKPFFPTQSFFDIQTTQTN
jgi:hypothetical protein